MLHTIHKVILIFLLLGLITPVIGIGLIGYVLWYFSHDMPDYDSLRQYRPPTITRVHASDGKLIAEYAQQRRIYVPINNIPSRVIRAFIAAEDKNFYHHFGIDVLAIARASIQNIQRLIHGGRPIGASTITQQVAKNFLLNNELSLKRKIKEAILAVRMERILSKDHILDLYLNEIYLGKGAYGVAAAALTYFNKSLEELTIDEAAFLAALPKAPNNYNPWIFYQQALERRNWIIKRMQIEGFISIQQANKNIARPLNPKLRRNIEISDANYFVEHVRRELAERYGILEVNTGGLSVRTTLDTTLQKQAWSALTKGLIAYDRRHGYRGALSNVDLHHFKEWSQVLSSKKTTTYFNWKRAIVIEIKNDHVIIGLEPNNNKRINLSNITYGIIPLQALHWARTYINDFERGSSIQTGKDVFNVGDIILVSPLSDKEIHEYTESLRPEWLLNTSNKLYGLRQEPAINGAIIVLDPFTGRILAMQGGFDYHLSEFNRATQALRQPGSSFKPFVYLAGLEEGYTPATLILDAPFVLDQGPSKPKWKPTNYSHKFHGLTPMRIGIEKSRNLMTVRLAQDIGMEKIADIAKRFGLNDNLNQNLATALGAQVTTLLDISRAYAQIVNGGKSIDITAIDRVQDRQGKTMFLHDQRQCCGCTLGPEKIPILKNNAAILANPGHLYQITSMLRGVVLRGSGKRINVIDYPLAGKTGTSNNSFDTWFVGFSPDLVVGVFVGFDTPRSLGRHPAGYQETGSSVAAPIFRDFMAIAIKGKAKIPFRVPNNIEFARINPLTGQLAKNGEQSIEEAFLEGTAPINNTGFYQKKSINSVLQSDTEKTINLF